MDLKIAMKEMQGKECTLSHQLVDQVKKRKKCTNKHGSWSLS